MERREVPIVVVGVCCLAGAVWGIGCFSPDFTDQVIACGPSGECPPGLLCAEGACGRGEGGGGGLTPIRESCGEHRRNGAEESGVYVVDPDREGPQQPFPVLCEMATDGGGWTVLVNNQNGDSEPSDCLPRLATTGDMVCGTVSSGEDFAMPATLFSFAELVWAAYGNPFEYSAHRRFLWIEPVTLPAQAIWTLTADDGAAQSGDLAGTPLVECQWPPSAPFGLRRVINAHPHVTTGPYTEQDVLTFFDQDLTDDNPGRMSLFEGAATGGSPSGLDDFQDGWGCGDMWQPTAVRGASSLIMVR